MPAASARRTSRDAVLILTNPAVLIKLVLAVLAEKTSSSCHARIPFWSNFENSGRPTASVCPPAPLEFEVAELGISGRGPLKFVASQLSWAGSQTFPSSVMEVRMPVFEVDSNEIAFVGSGAGVGLAMM